MSKLVLDITIFNRILLKALISLFLLYTILFPILLLALLLKPSIDIIIIIYNISS